MNTSSFAYAQVEPGVSAILDCDGDATLPTRRAFVNAGGAWASIPAELGLEPPPQRSDTVEPRGARPAPGLPDDFELSAAGDGAPGVL